jgi:hypothetical protein
LGRYCDKECHAFSQQLQLSMTVEYTERDLPARELADPEAATQMFHHDDSLCPEN